MMSNHSAQTVLQFWFEELQPKQWWRIDSAVDNDIAMRFGDLHRQAGNCELYKWRQSADGRLAEIIILDQFSRNIYRNASKAFSQDPLALALAQEAVANNALQTLDKQRGAFLLMPYMHSESKPIHEQAIKLFEQLGSGNNLDFELRHKAIIDRFGRYPHRNAILGRESTPEELAFLQEPGSSF